MRFQKYPDTCGRGLSRFLRISKEPSWRKSPVILARRDRFKPAKFSNLNRLISHETRPCPHHYFDI